MRNQYDLNRRRERASKMITDVQGHVATGDEQKPTRDYLIYSSN